MIRIGKKYTFKPDKFLEMCKEIYVPETITKVTCPNGHKTKSKFCGECGAETTKEESFKEISDTNLVEEVWEYQLDCEHGCFALTNIDLNQKEIIVFESYSIENSNTFEFMSTKEMLDIVNDKEKIDDITVKLNKYSDKVEEGIYVN
jgi:hypothetical protein